MQLHWEKNAIESKAFLSKSMYTTDSNQFAIELVTYLLVLVVYFYEFIVYMLLERNAFDSIAFFSQCRENQCFSRVAHDFFSTWGSRNGFVCPAAGNKMHFMTR